MADEVVAGTVVSGRIISSSKGTHGMELQVRLVDGRTVTTTLWLSDAAWARSEAKLKQLGFNGDFESPGFTAPACSVRSEEETYNGQVRTRWQLLGDAEYRDALAADRARLAARWGRKAAPAPARPPQPAAAPATQVAPGQAPAPAAVYLTPPYSAIPF